MIIIVMGVSGVGKTTVGVALAGVLGWRFIDADDLHPAVNVAKMARGEALTDADRTPWLQAVRQALADAEAAGESLVLACSALKAAYRTLLAGGASSVQFVYLHAPREAIAQRLVARQGHYMPPTLLDSQLATLEVPDDALAVETTLTVEEIVGRVIYFARRYA